MDELHRSCPVPLGSTWELSVLPEAEELTWPELTSLQGDACSCWRSGKTGPDCRQDGGRPSSSKTWSPAVEWVMVFSS